MSKISENPTVARYSASRRLVAIHLAIDADYAARLADAEANRAPSEGGFYLLFPSAEDAAALAPEPPSDS